MKTRKCFLMLAIMFAVAPAMAQFGVQGGATFSSLKFEYDGEDDKSDGRTGFTGGVFYRKQLGGALAVQPEVNWMQRGGKDSEEGYDVNLILNYLEVPIYLLYTGGNTSGFYAGAGPSFNFGISGKFKISEDDESYEQDLNFGSGEDDYLKGFYMGVNALAGYQLDNGINFNAFVSQSITNSAPDDSGDSKAKLFSFGLRVGYMLGGSEESRSSKVKLKQVL